MEKETVCRIAPDANLPFRNEAAACIGTGRMALALHAEYLEQLALVQREIGFRYIRGHGIFCGDMAILQVSRQNGRRRIQYNFTYLDRVMDSYRSLGLKPFLELGFMPEALASGSQTVFYYRGNVTPPRDMGEWCTLVTATLRHLLQRYGAEEVLTWPVEVWNEPNLDIFWQSADREAYFALFAATWRAVKALDARFQVGGPALCDVHCQEWLEAFLQFCKREQLHPDFISRHHYTSETPVCDGDYGYVKLHDSGFAPQNIHASRTLIDRHPAFAGLPMHLTEFNTSYIPRCPLHDTNRNAALLAQMLSWLGDDCSTYSYWTFGDVFEESGVPRTPFHGGFGLVADGCIPKPTFWTFAFYKKLTGTCVLRSENGVAVRTAAGGFRGVFWNTGRAAEHLRLELPAAEREWSAVLRTVDESCCNPLKAWHDLGEPASLSPEELAAVRACAQPFTQTRRLKADGGILPLTLTLRRNAVVYFALDARPLCPDAGYHYARAAES